MHSSLIDQLSNSLEADRSSENLQKWAQYLIKNNIEFIHLVEILDAQHPIAMRFTWLLGHIVEHYPQRIFPIVSYCFNHRNQWTFPGVKRSIAKMLWLAGVPEELEGLVVDELFKWVLDPKIKVAVKVYAIDCLYQLALKYPALQEELKIVIDDQWDKNSISFKQRAKKILKQL